jgi:hypothetical protein
MEVVTVAQTHIGPACKQADGTAWRPEIDASPKGSLRLHCNDIKWQLGSFVSIARWFAMGHA